MSNSSELDVSSLKDGYDLPINGLQDGTFYNLHVSAIAFLTLSIVCAVTTIVASFMFKSYKTFFTEWNKRDRLVVYMAICDSLIHAFHWADNIHQFVVEDHVRPKGICVLYAFFYVVAFLAENLLVNVIALNAFALIYFKRNWTFGKRDWKLLLWITFIPLLCGIVALANDTFGPMGTACVFDGVKGSGFYLAMVTLPILIIMPTNTTLYALIWIKLYLQMRDVKKTIGTMSAGMKASRRAVKAMALFVLAYIIQWWSIFLLSAWYLSGGAAPYWVMQIIVVCVNLGGTLNMCVFLIIKRTMSSVQPAASNSGAVTHTTHVTGTKSDNTAQMRH